MSFEGTELTHQQILAGNTALYIFPICVLLAFLVLIAQYENWSLPLVAILIVEFAREREAAGDDLLHAVLQACRLRLRPILMTSFAFVMGVFPLAIATGRGLRCAAMGVAGAALGSAPETRHFA